MFDAVLPEGAHQALATLAQRRILPLQTYLAGGTALALQLGHRRSFDFDFFTPTKFSPPEIVQRLGTLRNFTLERTAEGTVIGSISETQISLFEYQYPLLSPSIEYQGIDLAGLLDLSAMKLNAISDRGLRRDFVDLAILLDHFTLTELMEAYDKKFGVLANNQLHLLKALVYFVDAESDRHPDMLIDGYDWETVKQKITSAVHAL